MEKNVGQRLAIIAFAIVVGAVLLYPPKQKLRPGLDIAGGTSLIFEIDTRDAADQPDLAEKVKTLLQKRVDPKGIYNLTWRVLGRSRIEVQMPLPPRDAKERMTAYRVALDALYDHELTRGPLEEALRLSGEQRGAALRQLARRYADHAQIALDKWEAALRVEAAEREDALNELRQEIGDAAVAAMKKEDVEPRRAAIEQAVARREELLFKAAQRYDEFVAARATRDAGPPESQPTTDAATTPEVVPTQAELDEAHRDATELWEDAVDDVLATNLNRRRFEDILELDAKSTVRRNSLGEIKGKQPDLRNRIEDVIAKHGEWRRGKRFLDSPSDLKRLLRGSGRLEFRILAQPDPGNPTKYNRFRDQLEKEGRERLHAEGFGWFKVDNPMQFFGFDSPAELEMFDYRNNARYVVGQFGESYYVLARLSPDNGLLADVKGQRKWRLKSARPDRDQHGRPSVQFRLDVVGGSMFHALTSRNLQKPLCILVDDIAYSAPNIESAIRTSGQITGEFSQQKVNYLVRSMEGGTLPARLKDTPLSERTVGSSLGETNRDNAVRAGLMGGIAVAVIMLVYYLICGVVANVALTLNIILILAAMAMLGARITLVGIGGIILSVGMAVDANVLIYERIREEKLRGASLRMMIKNGYDKALSTIFDSNITTLLTCVIIYYVGSEEVKGFGLTLGWGIVLNLFTSIFVTRTLFMLLTKYNLIKDIKMMRLIGVPNIDWYAKRKLFIPLSAVILIVGLGLLAKRGWNDAMDVEFLGGVAAEFEITKEARQDGLDDVEISRRLAAVGTDVSAEAARLGDVEVTAVPDQASAFNVRLADVSAPRLAALLAEPLEDQGLLQRDGVQVQSESEWVTFYLQTDTTAEGLKEQIVALADDLDDAGGNLTKASVNAVLEVGGVESQNLIWNITTTVTNRRLVQHALESALGADMRVQPKIEYVFRGIRDEPYPITSRLLDTVVPDLPPGVNADLTDYLGGAAMYFGELNPPLSVASLTERLDNMHFQPDFQDQPKRRSEVIGIQRAGDATDEDGHPLYGSVVVVSTDPEIRYEDDPEQWLVGLADGERNLVETALASEQTLRKVMQFKPQIAQDSVQQASIALVLSWAMIIAYLWIRFGRPSYGIAGVVALIHDALIALAFVGISGWIGGHDHPFGEALLISDFKINMTIVAALLTIIGYSINDTIVVFDRIRETRGRLGHVTPEVINASINQTLGRTIMTSLTTFVVLLIVYIFGGSSIRGFSFCMMIGVLTGSYSSIAIASPLLMVRFGRLFGTAPAGARA